MKKHPEARSKGRGIKERKTPDAWPLVIKQDGSRSRVSKPWPGERIVYDPTGRYLPGDLVQAE